MGEQSDRLDLAVAKIAARQHGVVAVAQLHEVGIRKNGVTRRVKRGQFHRVHHGVYAVGHRGLSLQGHFMAAVLACGDGAVLSHMSAAILWELLKPLDGPIHVSVPTTSGRRSRRGIHLHRCPALQTLPATYRHDIPVTTVPRTIDDLRRTRLLPPHLLRRATRQAELKGHRLVGVESDRTRSDLEALFLALVRRHRLPLPEVDVKLDRWTVDFLWRRQMLVVETDSWAYHRGSVAFEADHERDLDLRSAGYTVLRFAGKQLEKEPGRVVADVARALEQEDWYSGS